MSTVYDLFCNLNQMAPVSMKMDFDNVGFLVGFHDASVSRVLLALDITDAVIAEAIESRAELIISHHPLFFTLKSVTDSDRIGRKITTLLAHRISAICMHTNLDAAFSGVNDALAAAVGITDPRLLAEDGVDETGKPYGIGRYGCIPEKMQMTDFLAYVKKQLHTNGLRYHDAGIPVHKVAVLGGSGGSSLADACARGCDTFLTADIKYDTFLEAKERGINLIDGDHFCTENVVIPVLHKRLQKAFPNIEISVSRVHGQTVQFC